MIVREQGRYNGEIDSEYFDCKLTTFRCKVCGWSGVVDNGYADYSFDGTDMPKHCPNCGMKTFFDLWIGIEDEACEVSE